MARNNPINIAPFRPTEQDQNQSDVSARHAGYDSPSQLLPSQAAFAFGVAKEILNDFLDEDQQLFAAAGLITTLILLLWRRISHQITRRTAVKVIDRHYAFRNRFDKFSLVLRQMKIQNLSNLRPTA